MFVFKLGLSKLQSCILMNGLVHEPNEVLRTNRILWSYKFVCSALVKSLIALMLQFQFCMAEIY